MDRIEVYRQLIQQQLTEVKRILDTQPVSGVEVIYLFDTVQDHYLLERQGWDTREGRVLYITLYLRIKGGKIWIEQDMTNFGIVDKLLENGVLKEDIVLGFQDRKSVV